MPQPAQARAWWADVEDVRERIERKRERESRPVGTRRGVREVRPGRGLTLVGSGDAAAREGRRRPRPRVRSQVGPRPDMLAAWAVALGFVLVLAAILSAHA